VYLLDLSPQELEELLRSRGQPAYRARQIWKWVWGSLAVEFREMTDLPLELRGNLNEAVQIDPVAASAVQIDRSERTEKALLTFDDGEVVEAVLMREEDRRTVCISTQVGCPVRCSFCATGQSGYVRNLTPGEIAAQVLYFARRLRKRGERVTHVVVMGMGEPMYNYEATLKAVRNLNHPRGFALGARRFTISTVGVVSGMRKLAAEGIELNLAVSLHAPSDELRGQLIPGAKRWPIEDILAAGDAYAAASGRRVSYEYVLLSGVNDSVEDARAVGRLLRGRLAHVNLIPFNPSPDLAYERPAAAQVDAFRRALLDQGVDVTVRRSRGVRIAAGCGQLRAAH